MRLPAKQIMNIAVHINGEWSAAAPAAMVLARSSPLSSQSVVSSEPTLPSSSPSMCSTSGSRSCSPFSLPSFSAEPRPFYQYPCCSLPVHACKQHTEWSGKREVPGPCCQHCGGLFAQAFLPYWPFSRGFRVKVAFMQGSKIESLMHPRSQPAQLGGVSSPTRANNLVVAAGATSFFMVWGQGNAPAERI
jgi:hypothetical protein